MGKTIRLNEEQRDKFDDYRNKQRAKHGDKRFDKSVQSGQAKRPSRCRVIDFEETETSKLEALFKQIKKDTE